MVVHLTLVRVLKGLYGKRLALRHGKALQSSVTSWNKTSLTHTARMTPAAVVHPCPQTTQGGKGAKPNQPHTVRSLSGLGGGGGGDINVTSLARTAPYFLWAAKPSCQSHTHCNNYVWHGLSFVLVSCTSSIAPPPPPPPP